VGPLSVLNGTAIILLSMTAVTILYIYTRIHMHTYVRKTFIQAFNVHFVANYEITITLKFKVILAGDYFACLEI
jgi:hypothetical protein